MQIGIALRGNGDESLFNPDIESSGVTGGASTAVTTAIRFGKHSNRVVWSVDDMTDASYCIDAPSDIPTGSSTGFVSEVTGGVVTYACSQIRSTRS